MLHGYTDSDWMGSTVDQKRSFGYCFSLGSTMISWSSRKQGSIAQSTAKAEYIVAIVASREAMWLKKLLPDLFSVELEPVLQEASSPPRFEAPKLDPSGCVQKASSEARFRANLDASWSFGSSTLPRTLPERFRTLPRKLPRHFLGSFPGSVCFAIHQANLSHDQVCKFKSTNHLESV
jgi:hypothetical protein